MELGPTGQALYDSVADELDLGPGERRVLIDAAATADTIAELEQAWRALGSPAVSIGSQRQEVIHPLIGEIRQQRTTLRQLIAALRIPDAEDGPASGPMSRTEAARKAAYARHGR
jgi:hypothetical protein